ncbi:aldo/keto reductase [Polaribacter porphyrae]|uniref:Aldo/keto reductase n=1 Tax=Polaribacter porphyrae TaxID=1137780 RepID=A0A2S7WQE0_9FLAO|nr:aldo/keto reductase [Polaribacter porphyrae]PQJ79838.1 aldo/keto reductase [Polaribacter porphyrae]
MPKSEIIIGCMSWGKWGKQFSTKEQVDMIQFCVQNGNSSFDHADLYGDYSTEAEFGKAFLESKVEREKIQLISKSGIQNPGETRNNKVKHYNYSKEYIIWSAEQSLKNLKTEYLDTFLLHRPSPLMNPYEIADAILELQEQQKIINFGVSNFTPFQVDLIADKIPVTVNQVEFSLSQTSAMENGSLDQMLQNKIQPMCWSPLGTIFREENEKTERIKTVLEKFSQKYSVSEDVLLLAWILKHPAKISPVIGTTNKKRILNANKALSIDLDLEDWFELLQASKGREVD